MNAKLPCWKVAVLDGLIQIALMTFTIFSDDRFSLLVGQVFDALLRFEMKFHPVPLIVGIDETEGVATVAVHVPVGCRNSTVAHHDRDLMQGFR